MPCPLEEHKTIIRHVFEEALNQRNVAVIDEQFAQPLLITPPGLGQAPGPAGTKQSVIDILRLSFLTSTLRLKASSLKAMRSLHARHGTAPMPQRVGTEQEQSYTSSGLWMARLWTSGAKAGAGSRRLASVPRWQDDSSGT